MRRAARRRISLDGTGTEHGLSSQLTSVAGRGGVVSREDKNLEEGGREKET